jgi:tripartite-type tricarboxylate transporter receptor subunit TctC
MTMTSRRSLLIGASAVAAGVSVPAYAQAQAYPTDDIHVICAFPPGSGADVLVRYFAEELRKRANRTVVVENKPGAGGNISAEYVVRSKPDGYTVYIHGASAVAANFHLFKKPPINPAKDIQVVATLNQQPFMVVVAANSPYKTMKELTDAMLKKGDKASYAQSATFGKVMGELYKTATGVTAVEVAYRTANDSLNDFASGVVDYGMKDPVFALVQEREGRLRSLAISGAQRMQAVPNLPTLTEVGVPGVELFGWFAAMVPTGTPRPIVVQLNKWFNEIEAMPGTKEFLGRFGGDPWITTADEGQAQLVKDQEAWGNFVKAAKIEPQG